jgi:hypothetical protein
MVIKSPSTARPLLRRSIFGVVFDRAMSFLNRHDKRENTADRHTSDHRGNRVENDTHGLTSPRGCRKHSVARLGLMFFSFLTCPPNKSKNESIPIGGILQNL